MTATDEYMQRILHEIMASYAKNAWMIDTVERKFADESIDLDIAKISSAAGLMLGCLMRDGRLPKDKIYLEPAHLSYITGLSKERILGLVRDHYHILYPPEKEYTDFQVENEKIRVIPGTESTLSMKSPEDLKRVNVEWQTDELGTKKLDIRLRKKKK